MINIENIKYIAGLAFERAEVVLTRTKKSLEQLSNEIELFDAIDCLNKKELSLLISVAQLGGYESAIPSEIFESVELLYCCVDLGVYLRDGFDKL